MRLTLSRPLAFAAAIIALAVMAVPAGAVSVSVNGQTVALAPPPLERAGRVFVPLRGVFERLGASVVYAAGIINAQGNGRTISLKIGSNLATINGSASPIDTPPFIVGATTYVPLAHILQASEPARNAFVGSTKPTLSATFARPVDANSVRIDLDGLDITSGATRSGTGFVYAPPSPLQSMKHTVAVTGKLAGGGPFAESYAFTSGSVPPKDTVELTAPGDGAVVGSNFTVSGKSVPNARVRIAAGATASLGGAFAFGAGNYTGDTVADAAGNFSQSVSLQTISGAAIGLTVTATDPETKESAEKKLRLRAQ